MFGNDAGATAIDDDFAARSFENVGAWIMVSKYVWTRAGTLAG